MNHLQRLRADRDFCVTLNRTRRSTRHVIRTISYSHPMYTPRGVAAQGASWRDQLDRRRTHYCGAYWGWGFHEDGVRSALAPCRAVRGDAVSSAPPPPAPRAARARHAPVPGRSGAHLADARIVLLRGLGRHRRHACRTTSSSHRLFMAYLDLDELPALFDGSALGSARRPASPGFAARDHLGDPQRRSRLGSRRLSRAHWPSCPQGPIRLLTHLRYFGHCFNPVSFYYCFDAARAARVRAVSRTSRTRRGASATATCSGRRAEVASDARRRDGARAAAPSRRQLHVSPLMGMDHAYELAHHRAGRAALGAHRVLRPARRRATRVLRRDARRWRAASGARASWRGCSRATRCRPSRSLRASTRTPLRLRLRGAAYHRHPPDAAARPVAERPRLQRAGE